MAESNGGFVKWLPLLVTLIGALSPLFSTNVDTFWQAHPQTVAIIAGVWASAKWLLPSPVSKS